MMPAPAPRLDDRVNHCADTATLVVTAVLTLVGAVELAGVMSFVFTPGWTSLGASWTVANFTFLVGTWLALALSVLRARRGRLDALWTTVVLLFVSPLLLVVFLFGGT